MNATTKFYKDVQSLLNDANKIMKPVSKLQYKDYDAMLKGLIDVMNRTTQLISSLNDVPKLDDDSSARFIFMTDLTDVDFGTLKQYSNALMYAMNKMSAEIVKSIGTSYARRYENMAIEYVIDLTYCMDLYCFTHWDKKDRDSYSHFPRNYGRRGSLNINDQREVIRSLFWMETVPDIEHLSMRDLRPHIQIMIRQSIEMMFKQIIGFEDIVDVNGKLIKGTSIN